MHLADDASHAAAAFINTLVQGFVIVNQSGQALYVNDAARELIHANDGLTIGPLGLRAYLTSDNECLYAAIAETCTLGAPGRLRVARPSGRLALVIEVAPSPRSAIGVGQDERSAGLLIINPEKDLPSIEQRIMAFFGVSATEARLVAVLAKGHTLSFYASQTGSSIHTARWLLKQALSKTGTRRQVELVSLVLRCMPSMSPKAL